MSDLNICFLYILHIFLYQRGPLYTEGPGYGLAWWGEAHTTSIFPWFQTALWNPRKRLKGRGTNRKGHSRKTKVVEC